MVQSDFSEMTVTEIQSQLKQRNLATSGRKDELIKRLENAIKSENDDSTQNDIDHQPDIEPPEDDNEQSHHDNQITSNSHVNEENDVNDEIDLYADVDTGLSAPNETSAIESEKSKFNQRKRGKDDFDDDELNVREKRQRTDLNQTNDCTPQNDSEFGKFQSQQEHSVHDPMNEDGRRYFHNCLNFEHLCAKA